MILLSHPPSPAPPGMISQPVRHTVEAAPAPAPAPPCLMARRFVLVSSPSAPSRETEGGGEGREGGRQKRCCWAVDCKTGGALSGRRRHGRYEKFIGSRELNPKLAIGQRGDQQGQHETQVGTSYLTANSVAYLTLPYLA